MRSVAIFMMTSALALAYACSDDGGSTPIDAPGGGDAQLVDAPMPDSGSGSGNACTGAAYDPCTDNAQCASNNCKLFQSAGIQVCTQACDAQTTCPTQNGNAVQCNGMGICRPDAANACTR